MDGFAAAGSACILAATFGLLGMIALFRADAREGGRGAIPLAAMVTLGAASPILLLAGIVLLGSANSDSFGR